MEFDSTGPLTTSIGGIFASDLVIRTALIEAIRDLRAKPWLLKYAFAGIPQDTLTAEQYGQNEVDRAVKWFLSHNIPVFLNIRLDTPTFPCISIKLVSSEHAEATLADVHYEPQEEADYTWPNLAGPFVTTYDQVTGLVVIPDAVAEEIILAPNQVLVDAAGRAFDILEVLDFTQVKIAPNLSVDFTQTFLRGQPPGYITTLESQLFKETYQIGCHAAGEAAHLVYLYSIVTFILLMYKQSLLEARNFERSQIQATDLLQNTNFDHELVYSRYINLTGYCENSWPKTIAPKITALQTQLRIAESGQLFTDAEAATQLWIGELDALGTGSLPPSPPQGQSYASKVASGGGNPLVYWGVANLPGAVDEAFVESLPFSAALPGRQTLITYDAGAIQYCWYAYPAAYGGDSSNFIDNGTGFLFGATNVATVPVTDPFGVTRPYYVFRSNNPGLGFVYLKVT